MKMNKRLVAKRYDDYGAAFEKHVKDLGGTYDAIVSEYLGKYVKPDTLLLDVAGGDGFSTSKLDTAKVSIISLDISKGLLEIARKRRRNHVLGIVHDFDDSFPFLDTTFDYVVCTSALEFAADLRSTLKEMLRVLKTDGLMLFTTDKLDKRTMTQSQQTYVHDKRGFFSRRYETKAVMKILKGMNCRIVNQDTHNAYRLEDEWVKYDYFLVRKTDL